MLCAFALLFNVDFAAADKYAEAHQRCPPAAYIVREQPKALLMGGKANQLIEYINTSNEHTVQPMSTVVFGFELLTALE